MNEEFRVIVPLPLNDQTILPQPMAGYAVTVKNISPTDTLRVIGVGMDDILAASRSGRYFSDGNVWYKF